MLASAPAARFQLSLEQCRREFANLRVEAGRIVQALASFGRLTIPHRSGDALKFMASRSALILTKNFGGIFLRVRQTLTDSDVLSPYIEATVGLPPKASSTSSTE
ncbi:hypothetical protein [Aminobacter sp. MDW-2]|uniref:hypothetical protein n=1 Tax=Aminobacter sp. MDW-2 TaxID=2666139 RepID=UPI00163CF2B6|nr:hypothetical protein [Aminobacter sp. MDW-2]QNH34515.1 hypothetical protein H5P29_00740 [Aminobacter sp. MDW-2]